MAQAYKITEKKNGSGYEVSVKGKVVGSMSARTEPNGRHCFVLDCDTRAKPRTYRGRAMAAEALVALHDVVQEAKKKKWSLDMVIMNAWGSKPRASAQE
jgi:hypothetical protein